MYKRASSPVGDESVIPEGVARDGSGGPQTRQGGAGLSAVVGVVVVEVLVQVLQRVVVVVVVVVEEIVEVVIEADEGASVGRERLAGLRRVEEPALEGEDGRTGCSM